MTTIHIEEKILQEKILQAFSEVFFEGREGVDFSNNFNEKSEIDLDYFLRPAGFRISINIWTSAFHEEKDIYPYLPMLSNTLQSRIFIDNRRYYGELFAPGQPVKIAKYNYVEQGEDGSNDYVVILEVYNPGEPLPDDYSLT